jgi:uncharacterized protein YozE (UPF0346 family)
MSHQKVMYRGEDIFTKAGMQKFEDDYDLISDYLWQRAGWI